MFIVAFCKIRRGILDHPRETQLDKYVLKFQLKTLKHLKIVILTTLTISLFLLTTNLIALYHARQHQGSCDKGFFHGDSVWFLNPLMWFITRFMTGVSAPLIGLYLFWRQRSALTREQLEERQVNERKNFFGSIFEEFADVTPGFDSESSDDEDRSKKSKHRTQQSIIEDMWVHGSVSDNLDVVNSEYPTESRQQSILNWQAR